MDPRPVGRLRIELCGVRGSTPAPGAEFVRYGGHTSCVALTPDGAGRPSLILDAGTGLTLAGRLLAGDPYEGALLLSHLHWDHTLGLPFFTAGDREGARVRVLMPEQPGGASATELLAGMMRPPYFPIGPTELRGEWTFATIAPGELEVAGFGVLAREIPHKGGRTFGYRITDERGGTLAYLPDHCPTALGTGADGWGEYHPAALELAREADVLIHDAAMLPSELAAEAGFGHAVADYAVELGRRAGVGEVVLFHHRHDRTDSELEGLARRMATDSPEASPRVRVAEQGTRIEV